MTALVERPRGRTRTPGVVSPALPQVNLLPPEVRAARSLRRTKRWLLVSLLLTLLVAAAGYGLAMLSAGFAAQELSEAEDETARLQAEQARYAEVPQVLGALSRVEQAREVGMSTDVLWKGYYDALTAVLPSDLSIDALTVAGATPMDTPPSPVGPLQGQGVGSLQLTGRSLTVPDVAALMDALDSVPGLADSWVSSVAVTGDDSGTYYQVTASVQLTAAAFSHRFDAEQPAADDAPADGAPADGAQPADAGGAAAGGAQGQEVSR